MPTQYVVRLEATERRQLEELIAQEDHSASVTTRAQILLQADRSDAGPACTNLEVAEDTDASLPTVRRVRRRYVKKGLAELGVSEIISKDVVWRTLKKHAISTKTDARSPKSVPTPPPMNSNARRASRPAKARANRGV